MVLSSTTIAAAIDRHPLVVSPDRMVRDAIAQMVARNGDRQSESGCAIVVENERVVGIVTERDLLHLMAVGTPLDRLLVCQVMNRGVVTLQESALTDTSPATQQVTAPLRDPIALFEQHGLSHIPIVDERDRLVGIVTSASLLATSERSGVIDRPQLLEQAVEDSDRELNHLFAAIEDVVVEIESGGNNLKVLSTNSKSLCYSPAEVEGKSLRELFPPEQAELFIACIDRALATETTQECQYSLKIDGVECWFDAKCSPLTADRVLWIARDISKQQLAIQQHQSSEATLNHLIAGTAATTGADFFPALVSHIATALKVPYVLISELIDEKLHVLAFWAHGSLRPTFTYHPVESPCERTLQDGKYYCESMIQQQFPHDLELAELGIESYLGVALCDREGNAIGNLCILDKQTIGNPEWAANILHVFAARAGAELERERATEKLATLNRELEQKVRERTAALEASEERCQLVLQGTNDGIWDWDLRTDRVFVSDRWKEIRGFTIDEAIDSPQELWSRIHPDDLDRVRAATEAHLTGDTEFLAVEYRAQCQDGSYLWIANRAKAICDEWGQPIRMSGAITDINDRKQMELALQDRERQLAAIAAAAPVAICRFDAPLNCTYVSDRWSQMTGRPIESALGKGWIDAVHPDDIPKLLAPWDDKSHTDPNSRPVLGIEARYLLPDGTINWFYAQATPTLDAEGNIIDCIGTLTNITALKLMEEALAESEAKFRQLVEGGKDLIFILDLDGIFVYLSPQFETLFGWHPSEWIGKSFIDLVHPNDIELILNERRAMISSPPSNKLIEFRHRHRDGYYLWVSVSATPAKDATGAIVGGQGILCDISKRKAAEIALQASEAKFRRLAENVPGAIGRYILHPDGRDEFIYISPRVRDLFEVEPEAVMADANAIWSKIHPEDIDRTRSAIIDSAHNLVPFSEEFRITIAHNHTRWIQGFASPERQENGDTLWDGVFIDTTNRLQTDLKLRQQAQQELLLREITQKIRQSLNLQTIFDTACQEIRHLIQVDRVGIFKFDPDSGWDEGEFVAESIVDGLSSVLAKRVRDHCFGQNHAAFYAQGKCCVVEDIYNGGLVKCYTDVLAQFQVRANVVMPLTCGSELWGLLCIHECSAPRQWQESEIAIAQQIGNQLAIAIHQANLVERLQTELTERQQAQLLLTQRNEELARATRLKDEFLANMSHELRTPLNAILGMTEGLQDQVFGSLNERQIKSLQTIERSGTHLLELINDILDVAKIESGQIELDLQPTAIVPLCSSSLAFIKQQALKKSIQLEIKQPLQVPDLLIDERRIRQVLINLLNNAVKFTPTGGRITLEITHRREMVDLAPQPLQGITRVSIDRATLDRELDLSVREGRVEVREYVNIAIIDTGIGIAPEYIQKLFQPFIQIDSALNRQYAGTGLGLALVKRIVEMHGGEVGLTSEVGVGSCFSIELPCTLAPSCTLESPIAEPTVTTPVTTNPESPRSPLILMAEDNESNVSTISSYLEAKGYRLLLAQDGRAAIELAQSHHPDLILMDIQMPVMDGIEAMQHIRNHPDLVDIPIIALTALAMTGDRDRCLAAGANDYISKPIKLKQLSTTIQQWLSSTLDRN